MKTDSLLNQTRRLLQRHGLRARKGLAQHFLVDDDVLGAIVASAALSANDVVIEVGPGLGTLTRELASRAGRVIAIELDVELSRILKSSLSSLKNVSIINEDILKTDIAALLREQGIEHGRYKVVANLPYYITSPVLRHFLESQPAPETLLVMVQKEVAGAIAARPGDMSILAVSVQLYGRPEIVSVVPAQSFYPPPDVDSALLKIEVYPEPIVPVEPDSFFKLVRAGFAAARKQIANSLAQGLKVPKAEVLTLLAAAGVSPERRAESLTLEEWGRLWRTWHEVKA